MSQLSCWIAAYLYLSNVSEPQSEHDSTPLRSNVVYPFLATLFLLWTISVALFLSKIKRKYLITFYSSETGYQNAMSYFLDNVEDRFRIVIFNDSIDLWRSIEPDVRVWVLASWERWELEKPDFFTEAFKAKVPDSFIPELSLEELKKRGGGERRRSSLGALVLGEEEGEAEEGTSQHSFK